MTVANQSWTTLVELNTEAEGHFVLNTFYSAAQQ